MDYEKDIIDDEEEIIFDDDEYYFEIDIKPILEKVLKRDIKMDDDISDYFLFEEIEAFIKYEDEVMGKNFDFSKLSEKERILYKLGLDRLGNRGNIYEWYIFRKVQFYMNDIEFCPYEKDFMKAIGVLKDISRNSINEFYSATKYLSLFIYMMDDLYDEDIDIKDILPYIAAGYIHGFDEYNKSVESECAFVEAYLSSMDGMVIQTNAVKDMVDDLIAKCKENFKEDTRTAIGYALYEKYRILDIEGKGNSDEGKKLLVEAKNTLEKRINNQTDNIMLVFDKHLLELIESTLERF